MVLEDGRAEGLGLPPQIELKRPKFWNVWVISCSVGGLVGVGQSLLLRLMSNKPLTAKYLLIIAGVGLAIGLLPVLIRLLTRTKVVPPIRFEEAGLVLPRSAESRRTLTVPYAEILSVDVRFKNRWRRLIVGTPKKLFYYPLHAFVEAEASVQFRQHLQMMMSKQPGGDELWRALLAREETAKQVMDKKRVATMALVGVIAAMFGLQVLLGVNKKPFALVDLGANAPALVLDGQWYRLVTANFLHVNLLHVYMNSISLLMLGSILERLMGARRFLLMYAFAAVGGSLASTLSARAALSVGASTAIFGALGALAVLNWRYHADLPAGFRQPVRWWIFILGLNGALPLLVPQIDIAAHLGGFLCGGLVTWLMYLGVGELDVNSRAGLPIRVAFSGTALISVVCIAQGVLRSIDAPDSDQTSVAKHFARTPLAKPAALNTIAWSIVTSDKVSRGRLEAAQAMAARAVEESQRNSAYLDTLATSLYRLGDYDGAISTEREALEKKQTGFYFAQLYRFLQARGPLRLGDASLDDVRVRFEEGEKRAMQLELGRSFPKGVMIYATAFASGRSHGMVRIKVGPGHEGTIRLTDEKNFSSVPDGAVFQVALLDAAGCDCGEEERSSVYRTFDAKVASLPRPGSQRDMQAR